ALPEEPEDRGPFLRNAPPAFLEALREKRGELRRDLHRVLREKGVVAVLTSDGRSDGGTVFGEAAGPHESKYPLALPTSALTPGNYNRITRFAAAKTPLHLDRGINP